MRNNCTGCPCLEESNFCFYYDEPVDISNGCGNSFTEKPEHNQEQAHEHAYSQEVTEESLAAIGMTMEEYIADKQRAATQRKRMFAMVEAKKQGKTYEEFAEEFAKGE